MHAKVFSINIPIFPPNSAEGLHFSAFHCICIQTLIGKDASLDSSYSSSLCSPLSPHSPILLCFHIFSNILYVQLFSFRQPFLPFSFPLYLIVSPPSTINIFSSFSKLHPLKKIKMLLMSKADYLKAYVL